MLMLFGDRYYLSVFNGANSSLLKQVLLATTSQMTPTKLSMTSDANGNGYEEIGILFTKQDGGTLLQLRDGLTLAVVKTFILPK